MTTMTEAASANRISSGIAGIDTILDGGLIPGRSALIRGSPGADKTLFGLHYLTAGVSDGETSLFINLGEPEEYLKNDAADFGFDTDTIHFLNLTPDDDLQFLADAVIDLQHDDLHRTVTVSKFRGSDFHDGQHSLRITDDGIVVSPRLDPDAHSAEFTTETLSSGIPELDSLLHGGLDRGTVTLLSGPTGVGKTTTGLQFLKEAADRGTNSIPYSFEEIQRVLMHRAEAINVPIQEPLEQGTLRISEIGPDSMSADEFAQQVRRDVEEHDIDIVMIDAIDGYQTVLLGGNGKQDITNLGRYLRNVGVTTIIANEVHRITGEFQATEEKISSIADTTVFFRHIEHKGELRKVLGVLNSRTSDFEPTLRELQITGDGLQIGESLPELRGILTGTPDWEAGTDD